MEAIPTAYVVLAEGFEELEAVAPIDLLRRAEVEVTVAVLEAPLEVTGRSGITVRADAIFDAEAALASSCLILPGGPGTATLRAHEGLLEVVRQRHAGRKLTAAICAAPSVLDAAGVLKDHQFTAHFTVAHQLSGTLVQFASAEADEPNETDCIDVVDDGPVLTSRGAGTATEFALALIGRLRGNDIARRVAESICAPVPF
ncbi:MAG: DJ-1 family glyoxalase III [Opitutales bacterium]